PELWDAYSDVAPPYVRRRDRLEVDERTDYNGQILQPLNEESGRNVARILRSRNVESVAVTLVNAYMNGANEKRMKEVIQQECPDVFVCTSHEILPEIFEHERTSTTVVNACLGPVVSRYLLDLRKRLTEAGYKGDVLVLHSGGGVMTAETISYYAARIANSGPTAGAMAGSFFAKLTGFENSIGMDMGGTSTDVSLMYKGNMRQTKEWWVEFGYPIMFPSIETVSIGAGGGSIAWIDEGGSLRNGPQSTGAQPGPACYMKGGKDPTNTDANLVLGRLNPSMFLGGDMKVSNEAAELAIKTRIADPLKLKITEASNAILQVANSNMCDAVRLISIRRGYDPREFVLVVFGGAGPVHGVAIAKELEISKVVVPPWPGITSAMGCLLVDIKHDLTTTSIMNADKADPKNIEESFLSMEDEARTRLSTEKVTKKRMKLQRYMDMRYIGQWRSLTVPCEKPLGKSLSRIVAKFHAEHSREYAYSREDQGVEIYGLRVTAMGAVDRPKLRAYRKKGAIAPRPESKRKVYFEEERGFVTTPIYLRNKLPVNTHIRGPAVVEQLDSTVLIPPRVSAEVDPYLNIIMNLKK
ncbi:MAG: hydantoinase/oxoprolinase family protein, partial [Candidatus Bathyarchaeia archaeon]